MDAGGAEAVLGVSVCTTVVGRTTVVGKTTVVGWTIVVGTSCVVVSRIVDSSVVTMVEGGSSVVTTIVVPG
jgi:hypothetical protein